MFLETIQTTTRARLPTRAAIATLVILAVAVGASAPAAAQTTIEIANSTADDIADETETILYQFDGGEEVVDIEFVDRTALVSLRASTDSASSRFAIAEGGLKESGGFAFRTVRVPAGETRTVELPSRFNAVVVTTTDDGYYHSEANLPTIVTQTPTGEHLQIAAISGLSGSLLAVAFVIGQLKRRHENSYTELFSDERIRIEQDAVDGILGWLKRAASNTAESKLRIAAVVGILAYAAAVVLGWAMSPFEIWHAMTDSQRLTAAGTITTAAIAVFPVYLLIQRIWSPARSFVFDLDARDVYRAAGGDKSGSIAGYSAPPSRIRELEVDGGTTTIDTPGGTCHLVRGMDPEANTAEGNPPEIADDREAILNSDHIKSNREIMQEMADVATSIIGYLPTLRTHADFNAAKNIDEGIGDLLSSGGDSMTAMLELAVEGTAYESEATGRPEEPDTPTDIMNDNDDDEATNDDGGQTDE